jgi:hypothetical protein
MSLIALRLFLFAISVCSLVTAFSIYAPLQKTSISSRQHFFAASVPVFMSETAETAATSDNEVTASSIETESASAETSTEVGGESSFEMTPEEAAAKRKIQRERYTLFVGNLPFGTQSLTWYYSLSVGCGSHFDSFLPKTCPHRRRHRN